MPTQKVLWFKEDRSIDRTRIKVYQGKYLKLEEESMAWERLRELCYPISELGSGLHMIIDMTCVCPYILLPRAKCPEKKQPSCW
jgi:hypothetical protein